MISLNKLGINGTIDKKHCLNTTQTKDVKRPRYKSRSDRRTCTPLMPPGECRSNSLARHQARHKC